MIPRSRELLEEIFHHWTSFLLHLQISQMYVIATSDKPELLSPYDFFQHSCTVIAQQLPPGQGTVVAHHLHHTDLCTASGSSHHGFSLPPDAVSWIQANTSTKELKSTVVLVLSPHCQSKWQ